MNDYLNNHEDGEAGVESPSVSAVTSDTSVASNTSNISLGIKILAVIGIVSLLSVGIWAGTKVVRLAPGALLAAVGNLTSIFIPAGEKDDINFTLESHNVDVGKEFTLSWTHNTRRKGQYLFSYSCVDGVSIQAQNTTGENITVLCGTPFKFENDNNTLPITVYSTAVRFVDVPVFITFISNKEGEASIQNETILTVTNTKISGSTLATDTNTPSNNPDSKTPRSATAGTPSRETRLIGGNDAEVTRSSDPNGTPDLAVKIIATGFVDKVTNAFTPGIVGKNDRAAVRFQVMNVGTKVSGTWSFIVDLPLSSGLYVYRPDEKQRTLYPGEHIEYTLGFDSIDRSVTNAHIVINVDTKHDVAETNRTNNTAGGFVTLK